MPSMLRLTKISAFIVSGPVWHPGIFLFACFNEVRKLADPDVSLVSIADEKRRNLGGASVVGLSLRRG